MHDETLVVGAMKFNAVQIVNFDGWGGGFPWGVWVSGSNGIRRDQHKS